MINVETRCFSFLPNNKRIYNKENEYIKLKNHEKVNFNYRNYVAYGSACTKIVG